MKRWPSLRQLEYLIALSEHQHFHRAAKACHVSQSTLSSGIQTLEEIVGAQLIERDQKSFIMTPLGLEVVQRSKQLLSFTQDMLEAGQKHSGIESGEVRIGCIPTIAPFILGDFVNQCSSNYPSLKLFLREDTTANLLRMLDLGELDLLVLALPVDVGSFHSKVVGHDPFKLIIHKKQRAHYQKSGDFLGAIPEKGLFLLESEHCLSEHALNACKLKDKLKINPFNASSLHTLVHMVSSGLGATLPQMAIDAGILKQTELHALEPNEANAYREIGIVWRPSSSRIQTFYKLADILTHILETSSKTR